MHKAAQAVVVASFDISLDCFGCFNKAKIFWMSAKGFPAKLNRLHQSLGEALTVCDFHRDQRPFSPHLSLLRKSEKTSIDFPKFSINWHVDEFVLVESTQDDSGVVYRVIERYSML